MNYTWEPGSQSRSAARAEHRSFEWGIHSSCVCEQRERSVKQGQSRFSYRGGRSGRRRLSEQRSRWSEDDIGAVVITQAVAVGRDE